METSTPTYAYKETRLDLHSTTQGSTVAIRLPTHGASTYPSRTAQKRPHVAELPVAEDENAFRARHLASAASIYHRTHYQSPRSFLWRILEDGKVLSIQSVDVSKPSTVADANITLRLTLPSAVKPGCIALADSKDHDILSVFILTESKQLYTLTLRPDHFRRAASTEDNVGDWCKTYSSAAFGLKAPHRLVALSADELLISTIDGALLRLERNSGGDGSAWKEVHYNEGGWGLHVRSMRIFNSSSTIAYGGQHLEHATATSIASPGTSIRGTQYAFTVCLDHRLRVWNLSTGKLAYTKDMLGQELEQLEPAKQVKKVIDPSQSQLVKVYPNGNGNGALCVTYSPLGSGQFKFWSVTPKGDGSLDLDDIFDGHCFEPQAPSSEIWTMADFSIIHNSTKSNEYTVWILWKNNVTYRLHRLQFQKGGDYKTLQDTWEEGWEAMARETLREETGPSVFSGDASDGTDKWLEYILTPGRYTTATIETCLAIYARGLGTKGAARKSGSLPDRMCATIASTASLSRKSDGELDYDAFRSATDAQWRRFSRLLSELDKQRGEAMSLAVDPYGHMPWVVLADGITAIRDCSALERVWHNNGRVSGTEKYVAYPLFAAATFRDSLPEPFLHACDTQLLEEIFLEPSLTAGARMRSFYEKCDFPNQIGDDEYSQLVSGLGGDFKNVTPQVYSGILGFMNTSGKIDRPLVQQLAEFGNKLLVKGVQETVALHRNICLDQLVLLVLIENEINHTEEGIQFETASVFEALIKLLKKLELLSWLCSTQLTLKPPRSERSNSVTDKSSSSLKKVASSLGTMTIFEGVFRHLFGLDLRGGELMSSVVTESILEVCAPDSNLYETSASLIQCFLLNQDRPDLATEFSRFADHDAFATYIQGRACLAANDTLAASMLFKKAAFGMAFPDPKKGTGYRSASYLDDTERRLLNAGMPAYYSHIVALFDKGKNYSYVLDFARLSLQFIKPDSGDPQLPLRTEMHSRLFNAAIQTARYEVAHSTLSLFTDAALQHSSLRTLVTKMCETSYASQLVELPFVGLQDTVDEVLAQKCQSIVDVNAGIPYHKILYAWRIKHNDFRGAAAISLERLQRLQQSGDGDKMIGDDGLETPVTRQYVTLINALSCVDPKQAWVLSEELPPPPQKSNGASASVNVTGKAAPPKRKVVTLEDVRKAYQAELDRIAAIENNQFAFGVGGDEMDVL
ncbi:nucleoporin Nup120/160-domain-containing protein [Rhexocercosporidium sp. MPI-PUGE-AT-0058]|nr:nucleoporin Nup120/160-domain-containing protein [Rhexocercosporidium sp. MPI-PUGE-AT-0058]